MAKILCCPSCLRPVKAADFMNPAMVGLLDSIMTTIDCECGYYGLPIEVRPAKQKKKDRS
ncbi:MAG: hypothetical protein AB1324_01090 [Candidatus Micrarchaeota archaeon]